MGLTADFSQARAFSARVAGSGQRIGARAAAVLRKTALDIEADAKQLAPVDTGNLRNSISSTITGDGRTGAMAAEIGPTADYGQYVEWGTSTQSGQPYLSPAFDRRAPAFNEALAVLASEEIL